MGEVLVISPVGAPAPIVAPVQADNDATLVALWLAGRTEETRRAYERDAAQFFHHVGKPLHQVTLGDAQDYAASLAELAPATQARRIAVLKSLSAFATKLRYLAFDVAAPLHKPRVKDTLTERIVPEAEVRRLVDMEPSPRNHVLLALLYRLGVRASEACALRWRDLKSTKSGGVANVFGKGGKTRAVVIQPKLWRMVAALKRDAGPDDPVFRSREGGPLDRSQLHRIVKAAARRAGVDPNLSAHWLRHAHASHALDHGAPLHVLQGTLGHASLKTTSRYVHVRPDDGSGNYLPD